jgi:hypothetical protein
VYYYKYIAVLVLDGILNALPVNKNKANNTNTYGNEVKVAGISNNESNQSYNYSSTPKNTSFNHI